MQPLFLIFSNFPIFCFIDKSRKNFLCIMTKKSARNLLKKNAVFVDIAPLL